ncbi:MAG: hypothetical protein ACFFED_18345, partial [Candidatus Thorarchaeota archaeon]
MVRILMPVTDFTESAVKRPRITAFWDSLRSFDFKSTDLNGFTSQTKLQPDEIYGKAQMLVAIYRNGESPELNKLDHDTVRTAHATELKDIRPEHALAGLTEQQLTQLLRSDQLDAVSAQVTAMILKEGGYDVHFRDSLGTKDVMLGSSVVEWVQVGGKNGKFYLAVKIEAAGLTAAGVPRKGIIELYSAKIVEALGKHGKTSSSIDLAIRMRAKLRAVESRADPDLVDIGTLEVIPKDTPQEKLGDVFKDSIKIDSDFEAANDLASQVRRLSGLEITNNEGKSETRDIIYPIVKWGFDQEQSGTKIPEADKMTFEQELQGLIYAVDAALKYPLVLRTGTITTDSGSYDARQFLSEALILANAKSDSPSDTFLSDLARDFPGMYSEMVTVIAKLGSDFSIDIDKDGYIVIADSKGTPKWKSMDSKESAKQLPLRDMPMKFEFRSGGIKITSSKKPSFESAFQSETGIGPCQSYVFSPIRYLPDIEEIDQPADVVSSTQIREKTINAIEYVEKVLGVLVDSSKRYIGSTGHYGGYGLTAVSPDYFIAEELSRMNYISKRITIGPGSKAAIYPGGIKSKDNVKDRGLALDEPGFSETTRGYIFFMLNGKMSSKSSYKSSDVHGQDALENVLSIDIRARVMDVEDPTYVKPGQKSKVIEIFSSSQGTPKPVSRSEFGQYMKSMIEKTTGDFSKKKIISLLRQGQLAPSILKNHNAIKLTTLGSPTSTDVDADKFQINEIKRDPGPLLSDIDIDNLMATYNWLENLYANPPVNGFPDIPVSMEPFESAGIHEAIQSYTVEWLAELMNSNLEADILHNALCAVAMGILPESLLAEDWAWPPYDIAEWHYVGIGETDWYSIGDKFAVTQRLPFGKFPISQEVIIDSEREIDSVQLYVDQLGEIYDNVINFVIQVYDDSEVVSGSTRLTKEGVINVPLDHS